MADAVRRWPFFLAALFAIATFAAAQEKPPAEVTLVGSLICDGATVPEPKPDDHTLALFAIDGTPEIRAEVAKITADLFPDRGLDADGAVKLMDAFAARLKYHLAPDSPALADAKNAAGKGHYCMPAAASAVTGTVTEKDGRRWIRATKIVPAKVTYHARFHAADKPLAMPEGEPVVLKVDEKLSIKCVPVPAGKFLMGMPPYVWPYFVEEYPHVVTLTRKYYLAEVPVTQAVWEAVMGDNPSTARDPELPVQDPKFADVDRLCQKLSERTGRKVRLPTDAEWEYAARVGTSDPPLAEKYREQNSSGTEGFKRPLTVRSKKPNAWGLYDMASCWWEITADRGMYNPRKPATDPAYPPPAGAAGARVQRSGRGIVKDGWSMATHEFIAEKGYAGQKFRVLVEAEK